MSFHVSGNARMHNACDLDLALGGLFRYVLVAVVLLTASLVSFPFLVSVFPSLITEAATLADLLFMISFVCCLCALSSFPLPSFAFVARS